MDLQLLQFAKIADDVLTKKRKSQLRGKVGAAYLGLHVRMDHQTPEDDGNTHTKLQFKTLKSMKYIEDDSGEIVVVNNYTLHVLYIECH